MTTHEERRRRFEADARPLLEQLAEVCERRKPTAGTHYRASPGSTKGSGSFAPTTTGPKGPRAENVSIA